ncbi:MAG: ABC-2 family transporter protein, partial [Gemmatimonadetes bacterium]|nr:ABC-2 family transporter protein [Gemmatimonadota bacterium]
MRGLTDIYSTLFRTDLAVQFQYRAAMVIWLIGRIVDTLVFLSVWTAVARSKGGQVGDFSSGDFAAYYIIMMMMGHLTFTWFMFEFEYRVRSGAFSPLLLQPLHPIHRDIAQNISYKFLTLAVMLPTLGLMIWIF